jgi:hypothetical protein
MCQIVPSSNDAMDGINSGQIDAEDYRCGGLICGKMFTTAHSVSHLLRAHVGSRWLTGAAGAFDWGSRLTS